MKGNLRRPDMACTALCLLVASCFLTGCGGGLRPGGAASTSGITRGVFPPDAMPAGKSYAEWSAAWWQWAFSAPKSQSPILDETGANAAYGQSGPVFFLAGTMGTSVERTCTIPAGKALFFPIVTSFGLADEPDMVEPLAEENKDLINHVTEMEAVVDGIPLTNLGSFRFVAPVFLIYFDANEPLYDGAARGPFTTVSDGYWIMLQPLSPGEHTIRFRAKIVIPAPTPEGVQVWETSVVYHLTVQ